ncbi:MAG: hypothetical protein KJ069_15505 [Anaerolineae bacterium]|nr:hypothetical protein [Anaerolineae bacterium]
MIAFYFFVVQAWRRIKGGWQDKEFRGLFWTVLAVILLGTVFYHEFEQWSWIDAFYFTVVTLATVGYGDLSPTNPFTKLFTTLYIVIGLGLLSSFILKLAEIRIEPGAPRRLLKRELKEAAAEVSVIEAAVTGKTAVDETAVPQDKETP